MEKIQFRASLPPIQSAIQLDGQGDGARIKIDVPRSDVGAIPKLQELAGKIFTMTIEAEEKQWQSQD